MEKYLTETEINKIESFVADEVMFEAVKKILSPQAIHSSPWRVLELVGMLVDLQ